MLYSLFLSSPSFPGRRIVESRRIYGCAAILLRDLVRGCSCDFKGAVMWGVSGLKA